MRACIAFLNVITGVDQMDRTFEAFVRVDGQRLRRVMAARYGVEVGCDAADAALAWAWEHWERVAGMANPGGYLYRVAQTHAHRALERGRRVEYPPESREASIPGPQLPNDELASALGHLTEHQRQVVLLVHAYGWTPAEVAAMTGMRAVTVRSHLRRGLRRLRGLLSEGDAE